VPGGRKAVHVGADFRQNRCGGQRADTGDRAQECDQIPKGGSAAGRLPVEPGDGFVDLTIDPRDRCIQGVVLAKMEIEQEAMMIGQAAVQRIVELGNVRYFV
jgi:hypothetical protein